MVNVKCATGHSVNRTELCNKKKKINKTEIIEIADLATLE